MIPSASTLFKKTKKIVFILSILFIHSSVRAQVTVPCNPPGWDVWLGITDDWNDNDNWCSGIPTGSTDVLIPGTGGAGYLHPVIKSSVIAHAKKLFVENDILEINAPVAGSLTVEDSIFIKNNSTLKVFYPLTDTAVLSNGIDTNTTYLPFRQSFQEQKMQLMYKNSELLAQGMADGNIIDQIIIPVRTRRSTAPYPVTIKMYYATDNTTYPTFVNTGFSSPVPAAPANCLAPQLSSAVTVFSGNIDFSEIPLNGSGNYILKLSTPFTFTSAGNNPLIVQICYSSASPSSNDDSWQTETVGFRSVLLLANLGAYSVPACAWTNTAPDGTALTQKLTTNIRPNLSFGFHAPYDNFPITVKGHWKNDGDFISGKSNITFNGATIQNITGASSTSFYDLTINNGSGVKLITSPSVSDVLNLTAGKLRLNSNSITILNPSNVAIVRTSGSIQSESNPPNYGSVEWAIGTNIGTHVIPFKTADNKYIPLIYNLISGDVGTVKASTYVTSVSNLPYPNGITNVNDTNNIDNSAYTVDRFWHLEKTGPSGKAKIKFTYANTEAPAPIANGNLRAQTYNYNTDKWKILPYTMTNTLNVPSSATSQIQVMGVTGNNLTAADWTLADASSPLRVGASVNGNITVFPNPFTDKITVSLNTDFVQNEPIKLTLYTVLGEVAAAINISPTLFSDSQQFEWSPGYLKNGIYFLVIEVKDEVRTERIVRMGN
jgi:hypothetical protein